MWTASITVCLLLLATRVLVNGAAGSANNGQGPACLSSADVPAPIQLTGPFTTPSDPPCHAAARKLRGDDVTGGAGGYPTSATSEGGGTGPLLATDLRWHSFLASSKARIRYNATLASEAGR